MEDEPQEGTGIAIGNFDLGNELVENRIRLMVLNALVNRLLEVSDANITQDEVDQMRQDAIDRLNEEYPALGVRGQ
jgi:hypothetical protein